MNKKEVIKLKKRRGISNMIKKLIILSIFFSSCNKLSNDEILKECNKCISNGYKCEYVYNLDWSVKDIICVK
jgi:hypothetical protein